MSKKLNRANNANAEAEEAIVTEYMEKQAAEAASDAAAKKAAFDSEAVTVENDAPVEDKGTEESAIDCSTVEQKDVVAEKSASSEADAAAESVAVDDDVFVEIDYVSETPELDKNDPNYAYFSKVFNAFKVVPRLSFCCLIVFHFRLKRRMRSRRKPPLNTLRRTWSRTHLIKPQFPSRFFRRR